MTSTWLFLLRELGLLSPDKTPAAPALHEGAFGPADLTTLQQIFDQACRDRKTASPEQRAVIARYILEAWRAGERDRQTLLDAALAEQP